MTAMCPTAPSERSYEASIEGLCDRHRVLVYSTQGEQGDITNNTRRASVQRDGRMLLLSKTRIISSLLLPPCSFLLPPSSSLLYSSFFFLPPSFFLFLLPSFVLPSLSFYLGELRVSYA